MLELDGLTRRFGDMVALDDVSFSVAPGQMLGFVGPNGAGKTTAMRIVLGVLEPDAGSVRWRGRPVDAATRARFGYMPEERGLYPKMRVRDQLVYFARLHGLAPGAAAPRRRRADRAPRARRARGDRVETLSLGNQQRVQLGVALVHDPEVLVLDEPFSGLDPSGVDVLSGVLQERADGGRAGGLLLAPARARRAAVRGRGDHQRRPARGARRRSRSCASAAAAREQVRVRSSRATATAAGSPACRARSSPRPAPRGVLVRLDGRAIPTRVLDAARAAGTVTHFSARAADARRPLPAGGGGVSRAPATAESRLVARREITERCARSRS